MTAVNTGAKSFIDSNIWLYAFTQSLEIQFKNQRASQLIQTPGVIVSPQIINEVCRNLILKFKFDELGIQTIIRNFYQNYEIVENNQAIQLSASELRSRYSISFWDSMIVASAKFAGTGTLYSEDMQHGLVVDTKLVLKNPFLS